MTNTGIRAEQLKELTGNDQIRVRDFTKDGIVDLEQFKANLDNVFQTPQPNINILQMELEQQVNNVIISLTAMNIADRLKFLQIISKDLRDNVQESVLALDSEIEKISIIKIHFNTVRNWDNQIRQQLNQRIINKLKEYITKEIKFADSAPTWDETQTVYKHTISFPINHNQLAPCYDTDKLIEDIRCEAEAIIIEFTRDHDSI